MLISGSVMSPPSRPSFAGGAVTGLTISLLVSPPDTTKEFFLDPPLDLDSEAANKTLKSQSSPRLNICCLVTSVRWWVSYVDLGQGTEYSMKDYATQPVYNVTWKHFNSNIDSEYQFKLDFASIVGVYRKEISAEFLWNYPEDSFVWQTILFEWNIGAKRSLISLWKHVPVLTC